MAGLLEGCFSYHVERLNVDAEVQHDSDMQTLAGRKSYLQTYDAAAVVLILSKQCPDFRFQACYSIAKACLHASHCQHAHYHYLTPLAPKALEAGQCLAIAMHVDTSEFHPMRVRNLKTSS